MAAEVAERVRDMENKGTEPDMLHQHNACFNTQQTTAAHCNTQEVPSKWDQIKAAEAAAHEVENHVYDLFKFSHLIVKLKAVFMQYARKKSVVLEPGGTSQNEAQVLFKPEFTTAIRLIADENKCPLDDTQVGKLWMVLDGEKAVELAGFLNVGLQLGAVVMERKKAAEKETV